MDVSSYLSLYLQECRDNCAQIVQLVLEVERSGVSAPVLAEIMRLSHSCKGSSATMGFEKTATCFHRLEDMFVDMQKDPASLTPVKIDVILQVIDDLEKTLTAIEASGQEPADIPAEGRLDALENGSVIVDAPATPGDLEKAAVHELPHVRVESQKLDMLLDLTGELSLLRQQFRTLSDKDQNQTELRELVDHLEKNVQELSYQVSQSRLIPLEQAFIRFPRLVRDLSRSEDKKVSFEMQGTSIELDKSVIDHLTSPIIHLLRNAVDHGIETPEERIKKGKPEEGKVTLTVKREAGFIVIGVEDDGQTIELEKLRTKAKEMGFSEEEVKHISEETILDLLTSARFSISDSVSMVSGRGVGLSAVKSTADALGGRLTLESKQDWKRFELVLPLNLSVVQVIFVRVNGSVYGIPFLYVHRLIEVADVECKKNMGEDVIDFEGSPLAIVSLAKILGMAPAERKSTTRSVIVVGDDKGKSGLVVDEILGNEEVMVKPVTRSMSATAKYYSGCTLIGDGSVALILDVASLIHHSSVTTPS